MADTLEHETFTLNTGAKIPAIGFGTWKAGPGEAATAVKTAFEVGYRHFDCAPLYGNEAEIGKVFENTQVPREEYFVTTKLWSSDHRRVVSALQKSLDDLRLDYVDLYLMHWPITLPTASPETYGKEDRTVHDPDWDFRDTWRDMEKLLQTGKVRAIGVANFSTINLTKLLDSCTVIPAVNQTEIQPLLPQKRLNALCVKNGVHQTAFGPLGGSGSTLHDNPVINEIAQQRGCSSGNVLLSWGVKKGWSVIPKSTTPSRITSNLQKCFTMDDNETSRIDELVSSLGGKRFNVPNWGTTIFHDDIDANVQ